MKVPAMLYFMCCTEAKKASLAAAVTATINSSSVVVTRRQFKELSVAAQSSKARKAATKSPAP